MQQADSPDAASMPNAACTESWPTSLLVFIGIAAVVTVWSFVGTDQPDIWAFELLPSIVGLTGFVVISRCWFTFSSVVHICLTICIVMVATGARYTYEDVPLFDWLQSVLGSQRNHADRVGHWLQGVAVSLLAREVLVRNTQLGRSIGVRILTLSVALAVSSLYELIEWWTVLLFYADQGPDWLGLQGDPWDTQWDMFLALIGGLLVVFPLASIHDRSIHALQNSVETAAR